jgi:hypothetical protein
VNDTPESIDEYRAVLATLSDDEAVYAANAVFLLRAKLRQQRLGGEQCFTTDYIRLCEAQMAAILTTLSQRGDQ